MALVSIPHGKVPVFPQWCPVCGHDCGNQQIKLRAVIELSIYEDELTFTITRDDYALEFADLNGCKAAGLSSEFEQCP